MDNTNSVIGNDLPVSWINTPRCWKCEKDFIQTKNVYRHPYILPCGHVLCSYCVSILRKNQNLVQCEQCPSKTQSIEPSVLYRLDCDYYLMGFINFQKNILPIMVRKQLPLDGQYSAGILFRQHELSAKDSAPNAIGHILADCKDHMSKRLDYYCQTCSLPICFKCTSTTHGKHDTTNLLKNNRNVDLSEPFNN